MPFAINGGVRIHYEVEGDGKPIIFMHGFNGSLEDWRIMGFTRRLGQDYRLILVSCRGRGESDKPHEPKAYLYPNLVTDLVAVLDNLKIDKVNYFGYSMGTGIGYRIQLYAPERFSSLILGGSGYPLTGEPPSPSSDVGYAIQKLEAAIKDGEANPMTVFVTAFEEKLGPLPEKRRERVLAMDGEALVAASHAHSLEISPDANEYLPQIKLPCLLYAGEVDPRFDGVKETANRLPKATFFSIPGRNHFQAYAASHLVTPQIKQFLTVQNL